MPRSRCSSVLLFLLDLFLITFLAPRGTTMTMRLVFLLALRAILTTMTAAANVGIFQAFLYNAGQANEETQLAASVNALFGARPCNIGRSKRDTWEILLERMKEEPVRGLSPSVLKREEPERMEPSDLILPTTAEVPSFNVNETRREQDIPTLELNVTTVRMTRNEAAGGADEKNLLRMQVEERKEGQNGPIRENIKVNDQHDLIELQTTEVEEEEKVNLYQIETGRILEKAGADGAGDHEDVEEEEKRMTGRDLGKEAVSNGRKKKYCKLDFYLMLTISLAAAAAAVNVLLMVCFARKLNTLKVKEDQLRGSFDALQRLYTAGRVLAEVNLE